MFKEAIMAALKKAGLPETMWEQVKVTTEAEIDAAVIAVKATWKPTTEQELIDYAKANGFDSLVDAYAGRVADKRVTEAIATHDKKKTKKVEGDQTVETPPTTDPALKAVMETVEALKKQVEEQNSIIAGNNLQAAIKAELKKQELSEDAAQFIHADSIEKVADAVNAFKGIVTKTNQAAIDKQLESGVLSAANKGIPGGDPGVEAIKKYAAESSKPGGASSGGFEGVLSGAKADAAVTK